METDAVKSWTNEVMKGDYGNLIAIIIEHVSKGWLCQMLGKKGLILVYRPVGMIAYINTCTDVRRIFRSCSFLMFTWFVYFHGRNVSSSSQEA
jgi:hypothetical protein